MHSFSRLRLFHCLPKIELQGTLVTHGRFQSKIQEIKNGESEKSCDIVFGLLTSGFSFWPVVPGGTSYDCLYVQAPHERGIFLRLQVYERSGI